MILDPIAIATHGYAVQADGCPRPLAMASHGYIVLAVVIVNPDAPNRGGDSSKGAARYYTREQLRLLQEDEDVMVVIMAWINTIC